METLTTTKPRIRGPHAVMQPLSVKAEAFAAASSSHPDVRNWWPSSGSADADLLPEQGTMMRRSRDLARNHGVAGGAQQTTLDNVLGCGLWLSPAPNYVALGRDRAWAIEFRKIVRAKWRNYAETTRCDAGESLTLDGLATQCFGGAWINGDGVALPLWMPTPGYPAATRIQVIESDRLSNPNGSPDSATLRGGIKINQFGAPQGYWVRNAHPGDKWWDGDQMGTWTYIPAKTAWGRRRFIHLHDKGARGGQSRGIPALASVLPQFKVLGDYQRAELKAAVVNAMVAMITESSIGQEGLVELLSSNTDALTKYVDGLNQRGRSALDFNAGQILPLMLGEKVSGFSPARPSTAYEPFVTTVFRHIATGLNMPYEVLMKDFSKTNYSSARAALLEAWRYFMGRRNWLSIGFYQPVYELWLEEMVNAGEIEAPGFYENFDAYARARWIGPGRGWVDPVKEIQAAGMRMDLLISTLEDECAEQGKDWLDVVEQAHEEQELLGKLGLTRQSVLAKGTGGAPAVPSNGGSDGGPDGGGQGADGEDIVDTEDGSADPSADPAGQQDGGGDAPAARRAGPRGRTRAQTVIHNSVVFPKDAIQVTVNPAPIHLEAGDTNVHLPEGMVTLEAQIINPAGGTRQLITRDPDTQEISQIDTLPLENQHAAV